MTLDALHTQAETARHLVEDKKAHYLMIIKGIYPGMRAARDAKVKCVYGSDGPPQVVSWDFLHRLKVWTSPEILKHVTCNGGELPSPSDLNVS